MNKLKIKQLPNFKNEDEERNYWAKHALSDVFDVKKGVNVRFPNLKLSTQMVTVRMPAWLVNGLKVLANRKDVHYQSLLKVFLSERVDKEFSGYHFKTA